MAERLQSYLPRWEEPDWEEIPWVSVGALRRRFPTLDPRVETAASLEGKLLWYLQEVTLNEDLSLDTSQVRLDSSDAARLGWKGLYFICPYSQARVAKLFVVGRRAVARTAVRVPSIRQRFHHDVVRQTLLGLLSDAGRGLPSGDRKLLAAELRRISEPTDWRVALVLAEVEEALARLDAAKAARIGRDQRRLERQLRAKREAAQRQAKLKADELGLWSALRRSEQAGDAAQALAVRGLSVEPCRTVLWVDPLRQLRLERPAAPASEHLRLDVRQLRRESAYWRPGALATFALLEGVLAGVDLRSSSDPHVRLAFFHAGHARLQRVELDLMPIGGRLRPRFICPVDGPVEVLALRDGRFASLRAQRLLHPSACRRHPLSGPLKHGSLHASGALV